MFAVFKITHASNRPGGCMKLFTFEYTDGSESLVAACTLKEAMEMADENVVFVKEA